MSQTPDNDAWLEQIRCPRYFDFEAALTIPCPNGGDTNPPLRDSVYESDDETRNFFRALETDSSLHHTPHPQENSPPRADLRNLRPLYRHRPATSFEEYLQKFKDSHDATPPRDSRSFIPQETHSPQHTPTHPELKAPLTPRRHPRGKPSRTPTKTVAASHADLKTPMLESMQTSKSLKPYPATPCRPPFQSSTEGTRKSAPNEPVPLRRRRPPERVTPPLISVSSKSTSGGFGRAKSRKAIARPDNADGRQGHPSCVGQSAVHSGKSTSLKKNSEKPATEEKEDTDSDRNETSLLDVDPDILRMMDEHNRRIQQKQAQTGGKQGEDKEDSGNVDGRKNRTHDQKVRRHGLGITLRSATTPASEREAFQWDETRIKRNTNVQRQVSSLKGKATSEPADQDSVEQQDNGSGTGVQANHQVRKMRATRQTASSLQPSEGLRPECPKDEKTGEDDSLDELLKSENERVLEERKKRLPERRRALQVDKNVAIESLAGQRAEQDRQRILARVEFTPANGNSRAGTSDLFEKDKEAESRNRSQGKENHARDRPLLAKSRKRGFKGFRERSKMGVSHPVSTSLATSASQSQKNRSVAGTRRRQPYTDKIKASERQKRLERRLEEDLQLLLSQHNSRVKGNRRACGTDEQ